MSYDTDQLSNIVRCGGYAFRAILHLRRGELALGACAAVLAIGFGIASFAS